MSQQTTIEQPSAQRPPPEDDTPRASLVVHHARGACVAPLSPGGTLIVGRQYPADVLLDDPSLSRQHARFGWEGHELRVEDLGSKNGTWLDEQRIDRATLRSGEAVRIGNVVAAIHVARDPVPRPELPADTILKSPRMLELHRLAERVATTTIPVLILGETGTGKEHVAQAIHAASERRDATLRVVNCAAIPDSLAESVLFGHERGAFTGASATAQGLFEQADGGTVFLDEVGELSPKNQATLLRTLETRRVSRIGGKRAIDVDVRVIAATHRDLSGMVEQGSFREDLFYRLNAITLRVPPLRQRPEEIESLVLHFLDRAAADWGRPACSVEPALVEHLKTLPLPGNIRQLRNAVEHAALVCRGERLGVADLPEELRPGYAGARNTPRAAIADTTAPPPAPPETRSDAALDFKHRVQEFEIGLIVDAMRQSGGNQRGAARLLRIPLRTLAHKMKSYAIRERLEQI